MKSVIRFIKETYLHWKTHNPSRSGAALSFYTIFSLGPFLIVVIFLVSIFFGHDIVEGNLFQAINHVVGPNTKDFIQSLIATPKSSGAGLVASLVGVFTVILGSLGVFAELKGTLNNLFNAPAAPPVTRHWWGRFGIVLKDRLATFSIIPLLGLLLLASISSSIILQSLSLYNSAYLPSSPAVLHALDQFVSFVLTTTLFAIVYRRLPRVKLAWKDLFLGAMLTAFFFLVGEALISYYLVTVKNTSVFGGAGSLVALMLWVYYSSQIFYFGASFTYLYSKKFGALKRS